MIAIPKKDTKKRFVIYTRCSTDDQAQGDFTTLDAQAHHCKHMLDAFGYELANFGKKGIIADDGYSGKDLNRPGIQSILTSVHKERKFDGIIFFRLDRLTRNPRDLYALIDLFKEHDVDFISVRENLDSSTAIGRVVIGILGLLSAFERELTGERVKASAIARIRQGKWVGGFIPFGYKLIKNGDPLPNGKQPHKVVIDEEIAPKLPVAWEMASDNKSLSEIGRELSRRGIKTPNGKEWRKQALSIMIKNPFYKGYVRYGSEIHKGIHQAIIDEKLWDRANKMLVAKLPGHRFSKQPKEYHYLVSGILKCGLCGSHLISIPCRGGTGQMFFYYVCGRAKQGLGCKAAALSATVFDQALIDYFKRASKDKAIIERAGGNAHLDCQIKLEALEKTIREAEEKFEATKSESRRLLDLAIQGAVLQGSTYKAKMAELDEEILTLEDKLSKLKAQKNATQMTANSGEFLYANIRFAMDYLDQAPPEAQKSLFRALIKEITVFDDRIQIKMFIDEPIQAVLPSTIQPLPATNAPKNGKRPTETREALTTDAHSSSERQEWLPGQDSNLGHAR